MRKLVLYAATSADGFIARPDGDVSWLDRPRVAGDYGMAAFYKTIDAVVMGRKTYDKARELGQDVYPGKKNYVFSRRRRVGGAPHVEFVQGSVSAFARKLRAAPGKDVWLVGGGDLFAEFLDRGEIDEMLIHVVPVLIGRGIPLFHPEHRTVPLVLEGTKRFSDGVVRLHYRVAKS